jgi:threonylcarbamoyladenosine tRNA methylthiotransferase MtaB
MATFTTQFLGCKVSHADAQAIREALTRDGHTEASGGADVAVVNACCVTHEAVRKSRRAAVRASRAHARVYVTGCGANLAGAFDGMPANVRVVARRSEDTPAAVAGDVGAIGCVQGAPRLERTRAFVKIQDGCSFSCAFCVVPLVRGSSRSRPAEAVVAEARRRVAQGHPEVVLSGVNLGLYRDRTDGRRLPGLVREVAGIPGLARLRLSSIEVNHLDGDLVEALETTPNVGRHVHVPLQSGDDSVLRAMGRRYTAAGYLRRVAPLVEAGFNLTADVIVGFPGEDENAFARTVATLERAGATKIHVFPYSPRPGTATAAADTVPSGVKRDRSARLRAWSHEACRRRWAGNLGACDDVLVDRPGRGYGADYSPWLVDAPVGSFARARGVAVVPEGVVGVV